MHNGLPVTHDDQFCDRSPHPFSRRASPMYTSTFPSSPATDDYLRRGCIIDLDETGQDMVNRVVTALADAETPPGPDPATLFADQLGWAMDTGRVVFSTPIMINAGRYPDKPLAACAVPPVDLRGDL